MIPAIAAHVCVQDHWLRVPCLLYGLRSPPEFFFRIGSPCTLAEEKPVSLPGHCAQFMSSQCQISTCTSCRWALLTCSCRRLCSSRKAMHSLCSRNCACSTSSASSSVFALDVGSLWMLSTADRKVSGLELTRDGSAGLAIHVSFDIDSLACPCKREVTIVSMAPFTVESQPSLPSDHYWPGKMKCLHFVLTCPRTAKLLSLPGDTTFKLEKDMRRHPSFSSQQKIFSWDSKSSYKTANFQHQKLLPVG